MKELKKEILINIEGGINITGTILNAFEKLLGTILDAGRSLGSSIRRISDNKICPLR